MKIKHVHTIFASIVLLLAIEYLTFSEGISVFRVLILPLCVLGIFFLKNMQLKRSASILWYSLSFFFVWIIGSNFFIGNVQDSITFLILLVFAFFLIKYFSSFPDKLNSIYKYTLWYAIPHEIVYLLILGGVLSMSDYTMGFSMRFFGFHRDPNFMTIFISIAVLSKIQYLKVQQSSLLTKIIILTSLVLDVWLVILGMSRGGILCLFAFVILQLISFIHVNSKKILASLILVALMSSLIVYVKQFNDAPGTYQSPVEDMLARFNSDDFSEGSGRVEAWKKNLDEIVMFPLTPLGSNLEDRPNEMYTHNTYIDILLTSGLVFGTIFIVFLLLSQIRAIIDVFKYGEEVNYLLIALVVVSQLFFLSLLTLKSTWLFFIILLYNFTYSMMSKKKEL